MPDTWQAQPTGLGSDIRSNGEAAASGARRKAEPRSCNVAWPPSGPHPRTGWEAQVLESSSLSLAAGSSAQEQSFRAVLGSGGSPVGRSCGSWWRHRQAFRERSNSERGSAGHFPTCTRNSAIPGRQTLSLRLRKCPQRTGSAKSLLDGGRACLTPHMEAEGHLPTDTAKQP